MTPKANPSSDAWTQRPADRTSQTDDARIKDITVLPPPEHLIRFFPIHGTPVESLKKVTMIGNDMRLDSGVGTCGKEGQSVPVGVGQPTLRIEGLTVGGTA